MRDDVIRQDGSAASSPASAPVFPIGAHAADLDLARRVLAGDLRAWRWFVDRFAGLLYSTIRRHLRSRDVDDVRSVFVDVLVSLRRSKLRTYEGRAALSTWLTPIARTAAQDFLRRRFGRGRDQRLRTRLTRVEQTLFRLHHVDGRSPCDIIAELGNDGEAWTLERFVSTLRSIERRLGEPWLRRFSYDRHARSVGVASGRMLEYRDHLREELEQRAGAGTPEHHLIEREARLATEKLTESIAALEPLERWILQLRFVQGRTAREIAKELGLRSPRSVYSASDRIIRTLRRQLRGTPEGRL